VAENFIQLGKAVLETESQAIQDAIARLDERFSRACEIILQCQGRVVVVGMGKSGHVGSKIAATLASTGTPAFFVHPAEAQHGDMGMITPQDVVITLSNSGETDEVTTLLPLIKRMGAPLIAMTGRPESTMGSAADVVLDTSVEKEACPLNLAPTASTTVTLAMGDALAVALLETRGFTAEDFALSHPAGALGRRLLLHVSDIMHSGDALPKVGADASLADALVEMTRSGLGMTTVVDNDQLVGVFTDGDLRRAFERNAHPSSTGISDVMTAGGLTINAGQLAAEALQLMEKHAINALPVLDDSATLVGAINMHDLLRAGVV
jgi:arabinose-5-phosphate isomerase